METVLWYGTECTTPWLYSRRYGIETRKDYVSGFWDRYPCMAKVNRELDGDTEGLAKLICDFADDMLTYPLEEVYEAIKKLPDSGIYRHKEICDFIEPVRLN